MKYKDFKPEWKSNVSNKNTYRSIFKWGNPNYVNEPSEPFYTFIKEKLDLTDEDFMMSVGDGDKYIDINKPTGLSKEDIDEFISIVGRVNVGDDYISRVNGAYGKSVYDSFRLRREILENVPDIVLSPSTEEQIAMILKYCLRNKISIYPSGGRTNTSSANECIRGGVKLDFRRNFNKVISFNEVDQTVTVMPGITGPQLEEIINNAPDYFTNVSGKYTCGHFPQSFEFSTVGGWLASRSRGQASVYYGEFDDILVSAKYLTPKGEIDTHNFNRNSGVFSIDELMMGTDGIFGLIVSVTLKVRRYMPDTKRMFSYIFRDWDSAVRCVRELAQKENGKASVMRLCDTDSTEIIMRMSDILNKGVVGSLLRRLGNVQGSRCVLLGYTEGENSYSRMMKRNISRACNRYGANTATGHLSKKWEKSRFDDAYLRDVLLDYRIVYDQFECVVKWSELQQFYGEIKSFFKNKNILNLNHLSHITPHTCVFNIAYINKFVSIDEYNKFQSEVMELLLSSNAQAPKNHSFGRLYSADVIGKNEIYVGLIKTLKKFFDPKNILNSDEIYCLGEDYKLNNDDSVIE